MSVVDNIMLPPTLLSRFDLIYLVLDNPNPATDRTLAKHLISLYYEDPDPMYVFVGGEGGGGERAEREKGGERGKGREERERRKERRKKERRKKEKEEKREIQNMVV